MGLDFRAAVSVEPPAPSQAWAGVQPASPHEERQARQPRLPWLVFDGQQEHVVFHNDLIARAQEQLVMIE